MHCPHHAGQHTARTLAGVSQTDGSFKIRCIAHTMQVSILLGYLQEISQPDGSFKIRGIVHTMQVSRLLGYLQEVSQIGGSFKIRDIGLAMKVTHTPRILAGG
jgi:hypothetical protein